MLDLWKDHTANKIGQFWVTECPWCYDYVEFYRTSPLNCLSCGRVLPDFSALLRNRADRQIYYVTGKTEHR